MAPSVAPIAVLGVGAVTPLGSTAAESWQALLGERSAVAFDGDRHVARVEGTAAELEGSVASLGSRAIAMACRAVGEAVDAALDRERRWSGPGALVEDLAEAAVIVGTSAGVRTEWDLTGGGVFDPQLSIEGLDLFHGIATTIATAFETSGPCLTVNTVCSSGATATAVAAALVRSGDVPVAIVCGVDEYTPFSAWGFESLGAYATEPTAPFERSDGLTLGEGAGALVLVASESLGTDRDVFGYLTGEGLSSDAHHPTAPEPSGAGIERALRAALVSAGASQADLGYVNVHGTGTGLNDSAETRFLSRVLPSDAVASGIKGATGHGLGAAGVLELIVTLTAVRDRVAPPTISARDRSVTRPDVVVGAGRIVLDGEAKLPHGSRAAATVNQAFGGHNSAILCAGPDDASAAGRPESDPVLRPVGIGGLAGWVDVAHPGLAPLLDDAAEPTIGVGELPPVGLIPPHEWIRLDQLSRHIAGVTATALVRSGVLDESGLRPAAAGWGLAIATEKGPVDSYAKLHKALLAGRTPNPAIFPRLVVTAAAGTTAQACGLTGPLLTFTSGRNGVIGALGYARHLVATGAVEGMVVVGADMDAAYLHEDPTKPDARRFAEAGYQGAMAIVLVADTGADRPALGPVVTSIAPGRVGWEPTLDPRPYLRLRDALDGDPETAVFWHGRVPRWPVGGTDPVELPGAYGAMTPLLPLAAGIGSGGGVICVSADELGAISGYRVEGRRSTSAPAGDAGHGDDDHDDHRDRDEE